MMAHYQDSFGPSTGPYGQNGYAPPGVSPGKSPPTREQLDAMWAAGESLRKRQAGNLWFMDSPAFETVPEPPQHAHAAQPRPQAPPATPRQPVPPQPLVQATVAPQASDADRRLRNALGALDGLVACGKLTQAGRRELEALLTGRPVEITPSPVTVGLLCLRDYIREEVRYCRWMIQSDGQYWTGEAETLLEELNRVTPPDIRRSKLWPKTASWLSRRIHAAAKNGELGVFVKGRPPEWGHFGIHVYDRPEKEKQEDGTTRTERRIRLKFI